MSFKMQSFVERRGGAECRWNGGRCDVSGSPRQRRANKVEYGGAGVHELHKSEILCTGLCLLATRREPARPGESKDGGRKREATRSVAGEGSRRGI